MASFAAIEERINDAVIRRLANATADFGSGVAIGAIFDNNYKSVFDIDASGPAITVSSAALPSSAHGTPVSVNGVSYTVSGARPDGTGITVLALAEA